MTTTLPANAKTTFSPSGEQALEPRKSRHKFPRGAKVYSYRRISTGKQRKGRGQQRQNDFAVRWCEANGFTLEPANCFRDVISGFKQKRNNAEHGELKVVLNLIEDGLMKRGSILLLENLDRLSRQNINIALGILLQIVNAGVIVVTPMDDSIIHDQLAPSELMSALMMALVTLVRANEESRTKSERKKYSWSQNREAAARGEYHGGNVPRWIKVARTGTNPYEVIEAEARIIRGVFADYVSGYGRYRLSKKYQIASATLGEWLSNPIAIGTLTMKHGGQTLVIPKHYPAIIDLPTWELAQRRRAERYIRRSRGRIGKRPNIFAGLLTDPNGKPMIVQYPNGKRIAAFVSPGHVIRASYLEELIVGTKLADKFVRVRETEEQPTSDPQALAKLDATIAEYHAMMNEEPLQSAKLLPALRKLAQQRRALVGEPKVIRERVDVSLVADLLESETDADARLKLRDLAQQSIQSIKLTRVESHNWFMHVHGVVTLADEMKVPFAYAYCTRREGYIITDGGPKYFFYGKGENEQPTRKLDDDLKAELLALPKPEVNGLPAGDLLPPRNIVCFGVGGVPRLHDPPAHVRHPADFLFTRRKSRSAIFSPALAGVPCRSCRRRLIFPVVLSLRSAPKSKTIVVISNA